MTNAQSTLAQEHGLSAALIDEVSVLIDAGLGGIIGPNSAWQDIRAIFDTEDLGYILEDVPPQHVLCHMLNRGGLLLNPFGAHKKADSMMAVGCDPNELNKAVSMEMNPDPVKRAAQIDANQRLIDRSAGLFAQLFGCERLLSLGTGHMAAMFRAIHAGCKTPQPRLSDGSGRLNKTHLSAKDKRVGDCLKGWRHYVIKWQADVAWPRLALLVQKALNTSQTVADWSSELENTIACAEYNCMQDSHDDAAWAKCAEAVAASKPQCEAYVPVLGRYARFHGGGKGSPRVKWLDAFAKRFAENRTLGEEYWKACTDTEFHPTKSYSTNREGFLAVNLISPKVINGISKVLDPAKVRGMASKDKMPLMEKADEHYAVAREFLKDFKSDLGEESVDDLWGRFLVRIALLITGMGKYGHEKRNYESFESVRGELIDELKEALKNKKVKRVVKDPWADVRDAQPGDTTAPTVATDAPAPFVDIDDPNVIAAQHELRIGTFIYEKTIGQSTLYRITGVGATINVVHHNIGQGPATNADLPLEVALKAWAVYKGDPPASIPHDWRAFAPTRSAQIAVDSARARLMLALQAASDTHADTIEKIDLAVRPSRAFAAVAVKKAEKLTLVPIVALKDIVVASAIESRSAFCASVGEALFVLKRTAQPATENVSQWKSDAVSDGRHCKYSVRGLRGVWGG